MNRSTKNRLTEKELFFYTKDTLFDKIARAVCRAGTLPRKELYEAWETARRIRREFRGGRVVDLACGHGLLAHILLILDDSSPSAIAVDTEIPKNAGKLSQVLVEAWPRLKGRIDYIQKPLQAMEIQPDDLIVSAHACGTLTDTIIDIAITANVRVAVLPCCHDASRSETGNLEGWLEGALAVDVMRACRLRERGYRVMTRRIPQSITPKNRLLLAELPENANSRVTRPLM